VWRQRCSSGLAQKVRGMFCRRSMVGAALDSPFLRLRFAGQHAVLSAEGESNGVALDEAQPAQTARKIEAEARTDDFKAAPEKKAPSLRRRQRNGLPIKRDTLHNHAGTWIPGIILP